MESTARGKHAESDLTAMEAKTGGSEDEGQNESGSEGEADPGVIYHESDPGVIYHE